MRVVFVFQCNFGTHDLHPFPHFGPFKEIVKEVGG